MGRGGEEATVDGKAFSHGSLFLDCQSAGVAMNTGCGQEHSSWIEEVNKGEVNADCGLDALFQSVIYSTELEGTAHHDVLHRDDFSKDC